MTRKHVITAVTCAVVIAMVITGVLVGIRFFMDSTNDIVKVALIDFLLFILLLPFVIFDLLTYGFQALG